MKQLKRKIPTLTEYFKDASSDKENKNPLVTMVDELPAANEHGSLRVSP